MIVTDALLVYALETEPSPLTVSPPVGAGSIGNVTIVVSAPSGLAVTVTKITLMLPVGDPNKPGAADLTDSPAGLVCSAVFSDGTAWTVAPTGSGTFDISPPSGAGKIGVGALTMTISAIVMNPIVGTAAIAIAETATSGTSVNAPRHATVDIAKFPYGFFIDDFSADVAEVANGGTATLTWVGSSGADYTITAGSAPPVDVSDTSTWTSPPLTSTTTFLLQVSAQEYGQTVTSRFPFTVTVSNPTYPSETVTGAFSAGAVTSASLTTGSLTVSGSTTLADASAGTVTATGVHAGSVTATTTLNASGAGVTMIGGFQLLTVPNGGQATFTASTDGMVMGSIGSQSGDAWLLAESGIDGAGGYSFGASPGAHGSTLTMPVSAGQPFVVSVVGQADAGSYVYTFVPFGSGSAAVS